MNDWKKFTDVNGNFQLANYIYKIINDLMKNSLDMGTLLSDDPQKLRAYKEQVKKLFKLRWYELAACMEELGVIEKCSCSYDEKESYCEICKGARYKVTKYFSSDEVRDISTFLSPDQNKATALKLQEALMKVLDDLSQMQE